MACKHQFIYKQQQPNVNRQSAQQGDWKDQFAKHDRLSSSSILLTPGYQRPAHT